VLDKKNYMYSSNY